MMSIEKFLYLFILKFLKHLINLVYHYSIVQNLLFRFLNCFDVFNFN